MDATEEYSEYYLKSLGFENIIYEPDGNSPPDFLVNDCIAVEVRRLNQNYFEGSSAQGLEEIEIPLTKRLEKCLETLGPPTNGESWFVYFSFSRPVENWQSLQKKIINALRNFGGSPSNQKHVLLAEKSGFKLEIICRSDKPGNFMFLLGGISDEDSGGWILNELEKNIRHCLEEKTQKILKIKSRYPVWWLVLVDNISHSLNQQDQKRLFNGNSIDHSWNRVIILNSVSLDKWFEL